MGLHRYKTDTHPQRGAMHACEVSICFPPIIVMEMKWMNIDVTMIIFMCLNTNEYGTSS